MKIKSSVLLVPVLCILGLLAASPLVAQTWSQLAPTGTLPPARAAHLVVHDPTTNSMIVFGGAFGNYPDVLNDVWVLSHADGLGGTPQWTQLSPTGSPPAGRAEIFQNGVYDSTSNRMILFSGNPEPGFCGPELSDVWVLTNANGQGGQPEWIQLNPVGGPVEVRLPSAVYDPATNRMTVFGGTTGSCVGPTDQVWVLSNANGLGGTPTWTQIATAGGPIPARSGHAAVYDPTTNRMVVFGGEGCGPTLCNDVWVLLNANGLGGTPTWTELTPTGGPTTGRRLFSVAYDQTTNRMIVFGGDLSGTGINNETWVLSNANGLGGTPAWTLLSTTGGPPPVRLDLGAVSNPNSNRMTVFGGSTCVGSTCGLPLNDTWVLTKANGVADQPPVANAGGPYTAECAGPSGTAVTLNGAASSDPDGDTLTYKWTDPNNVVVGTSATATVTAAMGTTIYTLTVTDPGGLSSTATAQVTLQDMTPPTLTLSKTSLTVVLPTATATGVDSSTLNLASLASATDTCDAAPTVANNAPSVFPIGTTQVVFTATDHSGNSTTKTLSVQVVYNFGGYLAPVLNTGQSLFQSGRTIPVKFVLTAADGTVITNAVATLSVIPYSAFISGSTDFTDATSTGNSDAGNTFRFDPTSGEYIFNLSTGGFATGTWLLRTTLNDGTYYDVLISIR